MAVCQNLVPLVNIKIAGTWMFIPLKMVLIGIDPYPCVFSGSQKLQVPHLPAPFCCGAPGPGEFSTSSGARVKSPSNFMHFRKENEHQPLKKGGYLLFFAANLTARPYALPGTGNAFDDDDDDDGDL